jgi:cytochrome P450
MKIAVTGCFCVAAASVLLWLWIRAWYGRLVRTYRQQVCHADGRIVPGDPPQTLFGNLPAVYRAANRLAAYNDVHTRLGEIVQFFWMWRPQVSVSGYGAALRVLLTNQSNYCKNIPNATLRHLFGHSVLSENGEEWKRHRMLMNDIFSARRVAGFQHVFVAQAERLASKWERRISQPDGAAPFDILPDLTTVSLDVIGAAALGRDFGALEGGAARFLNAFQYVLEQSTRPVHAFTGWWKHLPVPSSRRLRKAFRTIDEFLEGLIREGRERPPGAQHGPRNLMDCLLAATGPSGDSAPLTDREVRDNLLAILANGHQTVAISLALTLYLLARHPRALERARAEVDEFGPESVSQLRYLESVIIESLRVYPAAAGLQRRSLRQDNLDGWSIPPWRAVGVSLMPLHASADYFGESPEQFRPERYMPDLSGAGCPFHKADRPPLPTGAKAIDGVCLPLTFGGGARRCLGEHFAMYEMKVILATLIRSFDFDAAEGFQPDLDLDRFGLFIALRSTNGVHVVVARRTAKDLLSARADGFNEKSEIAETSAGASLAGNR